MFAVSAIFAANPVAAQVGFANSWTSGLSHAVGPGSNRVLVFVSSHENGRVDVLPPPPVRAIAAVSFGGRALKRGAQHSFCTFNGTTQTFCERAEIWYLTEAGIQAATGNTFSVTYQNSVSHEFDSTFAAVTLTDVDQTFPVGATASNGSATVNPLAVTSPMGVRSGDLVLMTAVAGVAGSYTPDIGYTEVIDAVAAPWASSTLAVAYKSAPATGSEQPSMSVDVAFNRQLVLGAVFNAPRTTDLQIQIQAPPNVALGDTVVYSIAATNNGPLPADSVVLSDALPSGLTFLDASGGGTLQGGVVRWPVTSLAVGANASVTLRAIASDIGVRTNEARVSGAHFEADPTNNRASATTQVGGTIDLALSKRHLGTLTAGETAIYELEVSNIGNTSTTGLVSVIDTLPPGLSFASGSGSDWLVTSAAGVITASRSTPIATGSSSIVRLVVDVAGSASPIVNRAVVSLSGDSNSGNNVATDVATVLSAGLSFTKAAVNDFHVGGEGTFVFTVRNNGTAPQLDPITIADTLPAGLSYLAGSGVGWTAVSSGGVVTAAHLGTLGVGDSTALTLTVAVGSAAQPAVTNTAIMHSGSPGVGGVGTVATTGPIAVGSASDLVVEKTSSQAEVGVGETVDYAVTVRAVGSASIVAVSVTDRLPAGFTFVSGTARREGVGIADPIDTGAAGLTFSLGTLAAGSNTTLTYKVSVGSRATLGDGINRAMARAEPSGLVSNEAQAGVQLRAGAFSDEAAIIGSVYSGRGPSRTGIPGVRLWLQDGTSAQTDGNGQYHFLALSPRSWVVRVDESTLPSGTSVAEVAAGGRRAGLAVLLDLKKGELARVDFSDRSPSGRAQQALANRINWSQGDFHEPPSVNTATPPLAGADLRQGLVVAGLLEARLDLRSLANDERPLNTSRDRFEDELESFSAESDDGKAHAGSRAALFAQGQVADSMQLTVRVDSEEDERSRVFRDIRPDEFYPTYGDASARQFDAQSKGRLYGRLQRGASFLQYGDFSSGASAPAGLETALGSKLGGDRQAYQLGRYTRTLNGAFQHYENDRLRLNTFASRDRFSQVVDEISGLGISGPYALSNSRGLVNSERIELVTRDRDQPALIVSIEPMERYLDYSIEPFSGRLLFKRPVPSVDDRLNPVSIRVSYEVERGGEAFWIYGGDVAVGLSRRVQVGGSYARDDDPAGRFDLSSVNASVSLASTTTLSGEWAQSERVGSQGDGQRLDLRHRSDAIEARAYYVNTDPTFDNPSAALAQGREEIGLRARAALGDGTALYAEGIQSEDRATAGRRRGWKAGLERAFGATLRARLGYRWGDETDPAASPETVGVTPSSTNALTAGLTGSVPGVPRMSLFGEFEQDVAEKAQRRLVAGADFKLLERMRVYGRHEFITSLAGPYALNLAQERNTTAFGLAAEVRRGSAVFSEYRVREALGGREAQAAVGLRNEWTIREGVRASTSFERVAPFNSGNTSATAVTGSIAYTGNPLWKGTAAIEYRDSDSGDNVFGSLGYARKLNNRFTFLGSSTFSTRLQGTEAFERSRVGIAYRGTAEGAWNGLARYEHRLDHTSDPATGSSKRTANVLAGHVNWLATTRLSVRAQAASKWATERATSFTVADGGHLAAIRAVYSLSDSWDVGAIGRSLFTSTGETAQWGLGFEAGLLIGGGIRLAAGYNVFGLVDPDLLADERADHGPYVKVGFQFDESWIPGIGGPDHAPRSADPTTTPSPTPAAVQPMGGVNDVPPLDSLASLDEPAADTTTSSRAQSVSLSGATRDVRFAFDGAALDAATRAALDTVALLLRDKGDLSLTIHGHADARGARAYNLQLSERRARAVASYLETQGIGASRLRTEAHGEEDAPPLGQATRQDHTAARRVELVFGPSERP